MQTNVFKSTLARLAGLALLSASLTACGGGGGSGGSAPSATATESASPASAAATSAPASGNHAPTISGSPAVSVAAGRGYSFVPSATDSDGDSLKFTISSKPSWAAFDVNTGRLSGTPSGSNVGSYEEIEIGVTDGTASTTLAQFAITVTEGSQSGKNVTVSWQPPTTNSDGSTLTNLGGYKILFGTKSGTYTQSVTVTGAGLTSYVLDLQSGAQYFVTMVAVNTAGTESDKSSEVVVDLT